MTKKTITFKNIAGYHEEKQSLQELCSLIANKDKLKAMGGKLPRGLFLIGPNGVGKTILAETFIKEANVPCIVIDGNECSEDDDFADYIKGKLDEASKQTPCIVFADEIDKLVGNNMGFFSPKNLDRSRILLNEVNNHSDSEGLFYLFVANEEYELDESMIRSGRIDRIININLPNEDERKEILDYYLSKIKAEANINVNHLATITSHLSGADIESLLNNAVIKAFTSNKNKVSQEDIMNAYFEKIYSNMGKDKKMDDDKLKAISYHEAGHAAATLLLNEDSLTYVTVMNRGNAEGMVMNHFSERKHVPINKKLELAKIGLAGLIAEEMFTGERSGGAQSDLCKSRKIITELVRRDGAYGIDKIVVFSRSPMEESAYSISQKKKEEIEKIEDKIFLNAYEETLKLLDKNKELVETIAQKLMTKKSLDREELLAIYHKSHQIPEAVINSQAFASDLEQ